MRVQDRAEQPNAADAVEKALRDAHQRGVNVDVLRDQINAAIVLDDQRKARLLHDLCGDPGPLPASVQTPPPAVRQERHLRPVDEHTRTAEPESFEAEEAILGAIIVSGGALSVVVDMLRPDGSEFLRESHGAVYRAALAIFADGGNVDKITLADRLQREGAFDDVGGHVRLSELEYIGMNRATANVAHWAEVVRETATLRRLIRAGQEITRLGYDRPADTPDLVDRAQEIALNVTASAVSPRTEQAAAPLKQAFERLQQLAETGQEMVGMPSGYRSLDRVTAGLEPGNLIVLAARPGMGKSALALAVAANVAIRQNLPVALFSLEMGKRELSQRLLAREAHVDLMKIRAPGKRLQQDEWARLAGAANNIANAPLYLNDQAGVTIATVRAELRRLQARHPNVALVVVDYLQLMHVPGVKADNRTVLVTEISSGLKRVARDFNVPVIALSQLNRKVEERHDKRPQLSDLRDSGSVEQDADLVLFLFRDGYYNKESDTPHLTELNLAKHRNGPTGSVELMWRPDEATFTETHTPGVF